LRNIPGMKSLPTMSRRDCLALGAGAAALAVCGAGARADMRFSVVVELFSSQGCSSCPPADRMLSEIRGLPGVLALSYHVDYWDYLGWKDTLASPEFSQRQYDYAKVRGDMDVYTPQMIVNGETAMVGIQRSEVMAALARSRIDRWPVAVMMGENANEIAIDIGANDRYREATLWVMPLTDRVTVKIEKGEMAGQEVTYRNVVRKLIPAGMWKGSAQRLVLPKDGLLVSGATALVALLQADKVGPVLGCSCWGNVTS
jgi:hypothetical protein